MSAHDARPSGTVTFLFTDIEGSTARWERDPAAMTAALRRHDSLLREVVAAHAGWVFKTIGDAFCVAFQRPEDAIAAARDAQHALAGEDFSAVGGLPVRMALHTGGADERDDDYFGPVVNRVARLLAIAHGNQVLLSGTTADLAAASLPSEATLFELGEHRLKDLQRAENVHQLAAPGLTREFPPLRSLRFLPNNLPQQLSSFVGRERELAEVGDLLRTQRLVTLVGSGGIGKTRLSLQAGAEALEWWPDGVWLVELAPLSDATLLPSTVGAALGLQAATEGDPLAALTAELATKRLLLILDNCEHLVQAVSGTVGAILRGCPGVTIVASSRQALGIAGETAYRMPSLPLPPDAVLESLDAEAALGFDAIALFVARAQSADARFSLNATNLGAIVSICRRLDGIPLALELAAARVRILSPEQLRRRLDQRFRVLTGGNRDAVPRQQTLRAAIDWSYDLLEENEQRVLRNAAIFVDGFSVEAAADVLARDAVEADGILDVLASLADKSLLQADLESERARFRLLESMRAYALEKLEERGERRHAAERHLAYFHALGESADAAFRETGADEVFMDTLAPEIEDLRAALTWALHGGDVQAGAELIAASAHPWSRLGHTAEGIARLEAFIAAAGERSPAVNARLWCGVAWLAGNGVRNAQALHAAERAVEYARLSADRETLIAALEYFAVAAARSRHFEDAKAALDESEERGGNVPPGKRGRQLELRGFVSLLAGDIDAAARIFEAQRDILRTLRDEFGEANVTQNLAELEHARGQTGRAVEIVRALQPRASRLLGREQYGNLLSNLAGYQLALDDTPAGVATAREAMLLLAGNDPEGALDATPFAVAAMQHLALGLALEGDLATAARLQAFCAAALETRGYVQEYTERTSVDRLRAFLSERIGTEELCGLSAEGRALSARAAIESASAATARGAPAAS